MSARRSDVPSRISGSMAGATAECMTKTSVVDTSQAFYIALRNADCRRSFLTEA